MTSVIILSHTGWSFFRQVGRPIYKQHQQFINNKKGGKNMSQRITITLSDEVYNRLKEQAGRDLRTIGAEISYLLQLHVPISTPENPTGQRHTPTNNIIG